MKPPMLYILAAIGLVLGGLGTLYSVAKASSFLQPRDRYVTAVREAAGRQSVQLPAQLGSRDDLQKMIEKQADALYSRRGVALPLAGMNFILSLLLVLGSARALRGQPWGLSAWTLTAKLSIPYVLLECAFGFIQSRDLGTIFRETAGPLGTLSMPYLLFERMVLLVKTVVQLIYFAGCVLYLRRPRIRGLYSSPPAA